MRIAPFVPKVRYTLLQVEEWDGLLGMYTLQNETMGHYITLETQFMKQNIQKLSTFFM